MRSGKAIAIFVSLAMILCSSALAVWTPQTSGTTQDLNAAFFLDSSMGFAAGGAGTTLKTVDGGQTWTAKPSGTTEALNDIIFASTNEGYILGAGGVIKRTVNSGESYATFTPLATADAAAEFKRGTTTGANRYFAASKGSTADSLLLSSTDSGATWGVSYYTNLEIYGIYAAPGGTIFNWGKYYAGPDAGSNVIIKGNVQVWTGTGQVNDVFFPSSSIGYAVGKSGLMMKSTDSGTTWVALPPPTSNDLNSAYFITDDFGWVGGKNGTIIYTKDGGVNWTAYTLTSANDINDIYVKAAGGNGTVLADAYAVGAGGTIYKLTSPDITSSTPTAKQQGWIGTVEVNGAGFMAGAMVTLTKPGTFDADPDITVIGNTFISDTMIQAQVFVSPEAALGARDLLVTNPDLTASKESNAFAVQAKPVTVAIENIWLDNNKYITPDASGVIRTDVKPTPVVNFDISSVAGAAVSSAKPQFVAYYNGSYHLSNVTAADLTQINAQTVRVAHTYTGRTLPEGENIRLFLYGEDSAGNVGIRELQVRVASTNPITITPVPGAAPGLNSRVSVEKSSWNMKSWPSNHAVIRLPDGEELPAGANIELRLYNAFGQLMWKKAIANTSGFVKKVSFVINAADIPEVYHNAGLVTMVALKNGKMIARNAFAVVPWY